MVRLSHHLSPVPYTCPAEVHPRHAPFLFTSGTVRTRRDGVLEELLGGDEGKKRDKDDDQFGSVHYLIADLNWMI